METLVIALGGNAISRPGQRGEYDEQLRQVESACEALIPLIERGCRLVLAHGNGPQVGALMVQNEVAREKSPAMPLHALVAESQGLIGYMIQSAMRRALARRGVKREVVTLITEVEVDGGDPAFANPTKPVGMFFTEEGARLAKKPGESWREDSGRGWRRVVPSPKPIRVVGAQVVKKLAAQGTIVVACGGGGIPTAGETGVEAVIDKDLTAAELAIGLNADRLIILTDVENVMLNYKKPNETRLYKADTEQMRAHLMDGQFPAGSMKTKVEACVRFAEATGRPAVIASLAQANLALDGRAGTAVYPAAGEQMEQIV